LKNLSSVLTAALLFPLTASLAFAQAPAATSAAPAHQPSLADAPPSAPTAPVDPLPRANPRFFTAASPTVDTVNSFLHQVWGFDPSRLYRVMAIMPTTAPGVTKVIVYVTEKAPGAKIQAATFFVTPDGHHAIGEGSLVVPFGATPFAVVRDLLKARADGAFRGAASKDLELVEFADLQCPHCSEAQSTMDQIVKDFPKAHVIFQLFPLVEIHSSAFKAAAYGVCAQKQSNDAFFKFADGVFDTQGGLSPVTEDTLLKAAAKRAGLDSEAIAACAATQATKDIVKADIKLAEDAGVDQTPTLSVNGRMLPLTGNIAYEQIKQLIQYQATLDGVDSGATAETLAPKPVQPALNTLPK
jgi:protein-disulfide isomerase